MTEVLHSSRPGDPLFWPAVGQCGRVLRLFIPLFMWARFSFGYLIGFNFYCMIAAYMWLNYFTGGYDNARGQMVACRVPAVAARTAAVSG